MVKVKGTIRWGIWSTGAVADLVARDLQFVSGATLEAVASREMSRAKQFATRFKIKRHYEGLEAMLLDPNLDVIYVASPHYRHCDDVLACLRAGKAVLCEKPIALNAGQTRKMADEARARQIFCMEAMWTRFIPAIVEAKRLIDAGAIGLIRLIQGNFAYRVSRPQSHLFDVRRAGGALLDRGVYLISLTQHMLGPPQSVQGTAQMGAGGVDEQSAYQLSWSNGAIADLASSLQTRATNDLLIAGEDGLIHLREPFYRAHELLLRRYPRPITVSANTSRLTISQRVIETLRHSHIARSVQLRLSPMSSILARRDIKSFPFAGNGYHFELQEVERCLRDGRTESTVMPLDDSLAVMRIMDELRSKWGLIYPQEA